MTEETLVWHETYANPIRPGRERDTKLHGSVFLATIRSVRSLERALSGGDWRLRPGRRPA